MDRRQNEIDRLLQLLLGGLAASLTDEEQARLDEWLKESPKNAALFNELLDENRLEVLSREQRTYDVAKALQRVKGRTRSRGRAMLGRWLPYAAAILITFTVAWLFLGDRLIDRSNADRQANAEEIGPGGNRATLTLANGRTINLDEAQTGIVIGDENITYTDGSNLELSHLEGGRGVTETTELLSLTTPKGGTYQVTLPDGSKVWLNANSTLKYPSRFSGSERVVELSGEAYFDIRPQVGGVETHNLSSFSVITSAQTVQVLGTEFNISAYADDAETKTTLLTGVVKVANMHSKLVKQLRPFDQSVVHHAQTTVSRVDPYAAVAWKSGNIVLTGMPLTTILKQIERWYDVDVHCLADVSDVAFFGTVSRQRNLGTILSMMETSGDLVFQIEGRKLMVRRKLM